MYEWSRLEEDAVICDVGGNNGHAMFDLVKAYPKLKVIVQDLESLLPRFGDVRTSRIFRSGP